MIHWITDNLGAGAFDKVHRTAGVFILDVRDLVDRSGNSPEVLAKKISLAVEKIRAGERVATACDYGMSRSVTVAAGVLALLENIPLDSALRRAMERTGEKSMKMEVVEAVRKALGEKRENARNCVFVTGGSGFLGRGLCCELENRGVAVFAPPRAELDLTEGGATLSLLASQAKAGTIVHLANPRIYVDNAAMGQTLTMLKNVIDACVAGGIRLVYPSEWEVFAGYKSKELIADENLAVRPAGVYSQTKALAEALIAHHTTYSGLKALIVRSGSIYGPGGLRPRFIRNFLAKALGNEEIVTHRFLNAFPALDLLYEKDAFEALALAANGDYTGLLHLGTGILTSTCDVAGIIVEQTGSKSPVLHIPIAAHVGNIAMNYSRASEVFGWRPGTSLIEGIGYIIQRERTSNE